MSEFWLAVGGGSAGAAFVTGVLSIIKTIIEHRHQKQDHKELKAEQHAKDENIQDVALRFILLYVIQERATRIIARGWTTLEERRVLHEWHNCYHNGLHGNGDADALLAEVDRLRIVSDPAKEVALQCN